MSMQLNNKDFATHSSHMLCHLQWSTTMPYKNTDTREFGDKNKNSTERKCSTELGNLTEEESVCVCVSMWRSYETNWDENSRWRYFEERKTEFEVVVFIFEGVGWRHQVWALSFFEGKCFRERENEHWDLHVWSRLIQWWNL